MCVQTGFTSGLLHIKCWLLKTFAWCFNNDRLCICYLSLSEGFINSLLFYQHTINCSIKSKLDRYLGRDHLKGPQPRLSPGKDLMKFQTVNNPQFINKPWVFKDLQNTKIRCCNLIREVWENTLGIPLLESHKYILYFLIIFIGCLGICSSPGDVKIYSVLGPKFTKKVGRSSMEQYSPSLK